MKKKKSLLKSIAILTTIAGAVFAVLSYLRGKSKKLSDELDFDNSRYFDDELDDIESEPVSVNIEDEASSIDSEDE